MSEQRILHLHRRPSAEGCTIGEMRLDDEHLCWTLEDVVRPDGTIVRGETAIPAGTYRVRRTHSDRFNRMMPLLLDVPDFEGIRIHWGNFARDTEGCPLVGMTLVSDTMIGDSVTAYNMIDHMIEGWEASGLEVWLVVHPAG